MIDRVIYFLSVMVALCVMFYALIRFPQHMCKTKSVLYDKPTEYRIGQGCFINYTGTKWTNVNNYSELE